MQLRQWLSAAALIALAAIPGFGQQPQLLTPDPMVLGPRQYLVIPFGGGHVYGKFFVTNPQNDVQCMVLDDVGLINFKSNHEFKGYYFSGVVAAGEFNLKLSQGSPYYLIFSNLQSIRDAATVVVKAQIYEDMKP